MSRSRSSYEKDPLAFARVCPLSVAHSTTGTPRPVTKRRRTKVPVTKTLTLLAACLGAVFVSYIVLEALDGDLDLWSFGVEDFTSLLPADLVTGSQGTSFALSAFLIFVMTAGAHLVLRHRARSA